MSPLLMTWRPTARRSGKAVLLGAIVSIAGCEETPPPSSVANSVSLAVETSSPAAPVNEVPAFPGASKWIGPVPSNVFFDRPLEVAANTTPTAAGILAAPSTEREIELQQQTGAPTSVGPATNWVEIVPLPLLLDELKSLRVQLTSNLQTVATYNRGREDVVRDAASLAAMGVLLAAAPDDSPWPTRAPDIRRLAREIADRSDRSGREAFEQAKASFESLLIVLDGGRSASASAENETTDHAETIAMQEMMKRIEFSMNSAKSGVTTFSRQRAGDTTLERELRIIAALSVLMQDDSYGYADEPSYLALSERLKTDALAAASAASAQNVANLQSALNRMQTSCAECHQAHR